MKESDGSFFGMAVGDGVGAGCGSAFTCNGLGDFVISDGCSKWVVRELMISVGLEMRRVKIYPVSRMSSEWVKRWRWCEYFLEIVSKGVCFVFVGV
jgi:hypothetical protein